MPVTSIRFHSEYPRFKPAYPAKCRRWLEHVILSEKKKAGNLNFVFITDEALLKINIQHLKHDYYTDIITFDYSEGKIISGELFISIDRVRENAKNEKQAFETELNRVMVHGVLHLLGYSDKGRILKAEMRKKEDKFLSLIREKSH